MNVFVWNMSGISGELVVSFYLLLRMMEIGGVC